MYLQETFLVLTGNKHLRVDIVQIHICCSHFFKVIANDVGRFFKNSEIKKNVKEIMASAFIMIDINLVVMWFKEVSILLNTPYASKNLDNVLYALLKHCTCVQVTSQTDETGVPPRDSINLDSFRECLYMSSPFYKYLTDLYKNLKIDIDQAENSTTNDYYNPDFFNSICKKYISILPLWSGVLLTKSVRTENIVRMSNATVENWFGYVKHTYLKMAAAV